MQALERVPRHHRHHRRKRLRALWRGLLVGILVSGLLGLALWIMNRPTFLRPPPE
jgi:4-amino-4-deoxy-L-arabinose transferase-like glycosyltransferase